MKRATAAPSTWPYPHRSVEEIDAAEERWANAVSDARSSAKGPGDRLDQIVGLSFDRGRNGVHVASGLPTSCCIRCGARGWCGHDGRVSDVERLAARVGAR